MAMVPAMNTVSVAAGTLGMRWPVFAAWDALAALLWAVAAVTLGYLTGWTFEDSLLVPLGLSLALALVVGAAAELIVRRRLRNPEAS